MNIKSYGILCESELGVDEFKNPKGDRILMESIGKSLNLAEATDRAKEMNSSGRFGKVAIVELIIHEHLF